jgi:hypothetical protein
MLVDYGGMSSLGLDKRDKNKIKFGKEKNGQAHFRKKNSPPPHPFIHAHTYPSPPSSLYPFFSPFSSFLLSSTIHPHTREREGCRVKESRCGRGLPAGKGRSTHVAAQEKERRRRRNKRSSHGLL